MEPSYPFPQSLPFTQSEIAWRVFLWTWATVGWFAVSYAWKRPNRWLDRPSTWLLYVIPGVVFYLNTLMPAWRADWSVHAGIFSVALAANIGGTRLLVRTEASRAGVVGWLVINSIASLMVIPFLSVICTNGNSILSMMPCRFSLMSLGHAMWKFEEKHERIPPRVDDDGVSWRIKILPFLREDSDTVEIDFHVEKPWNAPDNLSAAQRRIPEYSCPAHYDPADSEGRWFTAFAAVTGPGTVFPPEGTVTIKDIKDGTSNTAMIVEACGQNIVWTEPRDVDVAQYAAGINLPSQRPGESPGIWSSYHANADGSCAAYVLLASGSVRVITRETDPKVLQALLTIDGGEDVKEW